MLAIGRSSIRQELRGVRVRYPTAFAGTLMLDSLLPMIAGTIWICTRRGAEAFSFFASRLAEGMPVRAKDFSQSEEEGPRILPSMKARPGQRLQVAPCAHWEQLERSRRRIERTSFNCSELRQMSMKRCCRTLPQDRGNCTQG